MLFPEIGRTMALIKYINNHHELFTNPNIAYMVAYNAFLLNVGAEILNLYMLLY